MRCLTVIYDPECGLCSRIGRWLRTEPRWIPLRILSVDQAKQVYPALMAQVAGELVAVSDQGAVYLGDHAWLTCLHALKRYRVLARRLARPPLLPLARQAFKFVSSNRYRFSKWFELLSDSEIEAELRQIQAPRCHGIHN